MNRWRYLVLGVGAALVLAPLAARAADEPKRKPAQARPVQARPVQARQVQIQIRPLAGGEVQSPLLLPQVQEKLGLNAEQKEKLTKVEQEFKDKNKDALAKVKETFQKARQDMDREGYRKAGEQMKELQAGLDAKLTEVLSDEQKKKFEDVKKDLPAVRGAGGAAVIRLGAGQVGPVVLTPQIQQQLNLTAEQKEKIEKLQKEVEEKLQGVLTDEQKKKLEEIKKAGLQPVRIRPVPPPIN